MCPEDALEYPIFTIDSPPTSNLPGCPVCVRTDERMIKSNINLCSAVCLSVRDINPQTKPKSNNCNK